STPIIAVPIAPTATRMTPPEDCSSSQLHRVLNNAPGWLYLLMTLSSASYGTYSLSDPAAD
ncbi:MAG: hypothetical protein ACRDR6_28100, partial [Pseudonocardiaceae bacterium]